MKSNARFFLILSFMGLFFPYLSAQVQPLKLPAAKRVVPDTLIVYDTIYVTDTIRVYRSKNKKEMPVLSLEPEPQLRIGVKPEKNLIISPHFGATFSPSNIIDSTNIFNFKNVDSMKKIGFMSVVLFAFQNMILAQHDFSLQAGAGVYNLKANEGNKTHAAMDFRAGLGYYKSFASDNFGLNAGINYHFMLRSDFDTLASIPDVHVSVFNTGENFDLNYHMFNVPVFLQWNTKWFAPCIGAEFYYKLSPRIAQVLTDASGNGVTHKYRVPYHGLSLLAGIQIPLKERLRASLICYYGMTDEHTAQVNGFQFSTRMRRLEAGVSYRLR